MDRQWPGRDRALVAGWIEMIDGCLKRYFEELPRTELKLADYLKLAELELLIADEGRKKLVVRWVNCDEKAQETNGEDEDE